MQFHHDLKIVKSSQTRAVKTGQPVEDIDFTIFSFIELNKTSRSAASSAAESEYGKVHFGNKASGFNLILRHVDSSSSGNEFSFSKSKVEFL
jgi:hypothetical protein